MEFASYYARHAPALIDTLHAQAGVLTTEPLRSAVLHLLGRGKLYRPLLVLAVAEAISGEDASQHRAVAATVELVHTFTLIHDDLPCMDSADLRRGVATVHTAFDEATAVLAGDALISLAVEMLCPHRECAALIEALTGAVRCVIEGQSLDMQAEGKTVEVEDLERIHRLKTGALLGACCVMGGHLAGADAEALTGLRELGVGIGIAFQIRDDLLSVQGTVAAVGKSLATDVVSAKSTYPRLLGIAGAEEALASQHAANLERITTLVCGQQELLRMMAEAAVLRIS